MNRNKVRSAAFVLHAKPQLLWASIGLAIAVMAAVPNAQAQAITGGIHGSAPLEPGVTIEISSSALGFSKTLRPDANGRFCVDSLYPGTYAVKTVKNGNVIGENLVEVLPSVSTAVPAAATKSTLATVEVTGHSRNLATVNPIDVTTPELVQVYSAELTRVLPLSQKSVYAPWTMDSTAPAVKDGVSQLGGASTAENRTYFNEFDTTYDVTGQGAISLPQDAIGSTLMVNGSAGVDWTSTTGGIAAATVKQGSNVFHGGYTAIYQPAQGNFLRPAGKDVPYGSNSYTVYQSNDRAGQSLTQDIWLSGPILRDRLFFFAYIGNTPSISHDVKYAATSETVSRSKSTDYMVNLTWNINDHQSLNVIGYKGKGKTSSDTNVLGASYDPNADVQSTSHQSSNNATKMFLANYRWSITDNLKLRLMAGNMRYDVQTEAAQGSFPYVDQSDASTGEYDHLYGGGDFQNPYGYFFTKRGYKGDVNWTVGQHTLTAGADYYKNNYHYFATSGDNWFYSINNPPGTTTGNGTPVPTTGPQANNYVTSYEYAIGGDFVANQKGVYLSDFWQFNNRLLLTAGVRWDRNTNLEANGVPYFDTKLVSPRLGLAWDVHGDSSLKIGANIGSYTLPMPSGLSYYIASYQYYAQQDSTYTGMDPTTKAPTGLNPLGSKITYLAGNVPDPSLLSSRNLRNTKQTELQVYFQKQLNPTWSLLGQFEAHKLTRIVDSISDSNGILTDYIRTHGYSDFVGFGGNAVLFNPGQDIVIRGNLNNDGKTAEVTIPKAFLGMPAPQRKYYALTFKLDHAKTDKEPYFLEVGYTWSHLYGNEDGYANESRNTSQDGGNSKNYSYAQLTPGMFGNLTADIRHRLVITDVYYYSNGLHASSILNLQTGVPYGCFGTYPDQATVTSIPQLAQSTHYCGASVVPLNSLGRHPGVVRLDLGVGYEFSFLGRNKLNLDFLVTNVFNQQAASARNTAYDLGTFSNGSPTPNPRYMTVTGLQAPRSANLTLRASF